MKNQLFVVKILSSVQDEITDLCTSSDAAPCQISHVNELIANFIAFN